MHPMGEGVSWGFSFRLTGNRRLIWFERVEAKSVMRQIAALTYYSQLEQDSVNQSRLLHRARSSRPQEQSDCVLALFFFLTHSSSLSLSVFLTETHTEVACQSLR